MNDQEIPKYDPSLPNPLYKVYDTETICTMCQCKEGTHALFNSCPIMDNNPICHDCCLIGCLKDDIALQFSNTTGKQLTLEQVNEACKACGKNYAKQNPELAKKLENESM